MSAALEVKLGSEIARLLKHCNNIAPHLDMARRTRVSNDVHTMLSSRKGHIDPIGGAQEPTFILLIASHKRNHYYLCFLALKVVDGRHFKGVEQCCLSRDWRRTRRRIRLIFQSLPFDLQNVSFTHGNFVSAAEDSPE